MSTDSAKESQASCPSDIESRSGVPSYIEVRSVGYLGFDAPKECREGRDASADKKTRTEVRRLFASRKTASIVASALCLAVLALFIAAGAFGLGAKDVVAANPSLFQTTQDVLENADGGDDAAKFTDADAGTDGVDQGNEASSEAVGDSAGSQANSSTSDALQGASDSAGDVGASGASGSSASSGDLGSNTGATDTYSGQSSADSLSQNASSAKGLSSSDSGASGGFANEGASTNTQSTASERDGISVRLEVTSALVGNPVSYSASLSLKQGASAYDALVASGLSVVANNSVFGTYVSAIGGLSERDWGSESGWKYAVNGIDAACSSSAYVLSSDDVVSWRYVTSLDG